MIKGNINATNKVNALCHETQRVTSQMCAMSHIFVNYKNIAILTNTGE